jgi:hypothetical protein
LRRRTNGGKKLVADLSLDNAILKDAAEGNFYALHDTGQQSNKRWNGTGFLNVGHVGYWVSHDRRKDTK